MDQRTSLQKKMTPNQHLVASTVTAGIFGAVTRSWEGTLVCFLSGIFIDLDHLLDFYWIKKRMCWSLKELCDFCLKGREGKIYLIFHSYELMAVLWIIVLLFFVNPIGLGLMFGLTVHMFLDQIGNPVYPGAYSWFCRRRFGFQKKIFFKDDFLKDHPELKK